MIIYGYVYDTDDNKNLANRLAHLAEADWRETPYAWREFVHTCYTVGAGNITTAMVGIVLDYGDDLFWPQPINKTRLKPTAKQVKKLREMVKSDKILTKLLGKKKPTVYSFVTSDD